MDKVGETDTPEELTTKEATFKAMLFFLWANEYRHELSFEDMRRSDFLGRDEYPETIN